MMSRALLKRPHSLVVNHRHGNRDIYSTRKQVQMRSKLYSRHWGNSLQHNTDYDSLHCWWTAKSLLATTRTLPLPPSFTLLFASAHPIGGSPNDLLLQSRIWEEEMKKNYKKKITDSVSLFPLQAHGTTVQAHTTAGQCCRCLFSGKKRKPSLSRQ